MSASSQDRIRNAVRDRYGDIARNDSGCCGSSCCSADSAANASARLGYSAAELAAVPDSADLGLGCGNPTAIASLKKGDTVLDLGSGGGFDCFIAARQVGNEGRVIGVDMTPDMITRARSAAEQNGYENVEFRLGEIEHIPVADNTVDVIMSNCVINLSPDKPQVFRDACRVLKPGGRLAIADVVATRELPDAIKANMDQHAGCVAGAALVSDIEEMLHAAGFRGISVVTKAASREFIKDWFPGSGIEDYVVSANIEANKPCSDTETAGVTADERIKELIAIGASVSGHCQPCLGYHVRKARDLGTDEETIKRAIAVGHMVEKGAMSSMQKFVIGALDAPVKDVPDCCSGDAVRNNVNCCTKVRQGELG